ncbi:MAG: Na+/H+ antiporter NhaA [Bacteroidaceae bacterium]|nr:Na+/H+ antiporter NhaA [Bacteroidaceae bacterium]
MDTENKQQATSPTKNEWGEHIPNNVSYSFVSLLRRYISASVLLIIATVLALIVANSPWGDAYAQIWQQPVSLSIGPLNLFSHGGHAMSLGMFINDYLMAIFFLSVGLEIKREMLCGELSSVKKALAPVIGACGGMIVPVVVFHLLCPADPAMQRGMAIPMATDIAFSLGVLSVFSKRVPIGLKVFLATLAVADDLGGILVIAVRYTEELSWTYLAIAAVCIIVLLIGNWRQVRTKAFYFTVGIILWFCMLNSGIHATIAGVALAFCVPANLPRGTKYYIERIRHAINCFPETVVSKADRNKPVILSEKEISTLKRIESASDQLISPLQDIEDILKVPVNFYILPIFAFANAGVCFSGMSLENLFSGVGLAVFLGLFLGKLSGVFSFTWLFIKLRVIQMPKGGTWPILASICMLCGIGFTVSMFMANLSYDSPDHLLLLNDAKLGILCGSVASALSGCLMLHVTLPKAEE